MITPNPIPTAQLEAVLNWRYATKKFDAAKKIAPDIWATLEKALLLAPSSLGLQPWKFVVVTNPEVKAKLKAVSYGNTQPADCSHLVVFALRKDIDAAYVQRYIARAAEVLGVDTESLNAFRDMVGGYVVGASKDGTLNPSQRNQVFIALGQFMTCAAMLGVDTCALGGIQPEEYDEILGLTGSHYSTVVACAAGYRAADDKYALRKKVRFAPQEVITYVK
ncbi:MAG: NAD(P)H-dependent oxidoreductase [Puniceicoccales bacterium]|jgi:nitroreductase|nr:NAD(P)H-dependent oxidoreductase [Puniceicoccales bacterium]